MHVVFYSFSAAIVFDAISIDMHMRHRGYGGGRSHTRKIKKLRTGMEEAETTLEASQQAEFSEGRSMVSLEATELMEGASGSDEWKPRTDECQLYYVTCRSQ